jgi:hypothetical protein
MAGGIGLELDGVGPGSLASHNGQAPVEVPWLWLPLSSAMMNRGSGGLQVQAKRINHGAKYAATG